MERDIASADEAHQAGRDRVLAAEDRSDAELDRQEGASRAAAALRRDSAAGARDIASVDEAHQAAHGRVLAAEDRSDAELDRQEGASRAAAALRRDTAAGARDAASAATGEAKGAANDRILAAEDRSSAELDRQDGALRAAAALGRDTAAGARDSASAGEAERGAHDRILAAEDRSSAELDRQDGAARAAAAARRDTAAGARDTISAGEAQQAERDRILAAEDRAAAALDRQEAALDRRGAAEYLKRSYHDDLTETLLRGAGRDQLSHEVDRAHRSGEPLIIAYLDVDHLKRINDSEGHAAGDRLLHAIGSALRHGLRSYDIVVRYGGDEFVCAIPGTLIAEAEQRFTEIGENLSQAITGASVSIGLAELRTDESLDQLIGRADRDMYDQRKLRQAIPKQTPPSRPPDGEIIGKSR